MSESQGKLPRERRNKMIGLGRASIFLCLLPAWSEVRVWQDSQTLPTYHETAPDPNPPYWFFTPANPVYPYTIRKGFTKTRTDHGWRTLRIENEYLSCIVLPDLGGHLYSCKDKLSGQEMFHANPVVKKAAVGPRGAWVAMGIEPNFPTGHSWVAVSPVDFATMQNADGSASIWVGNIDRVTEMQWRVEFVLRPGSAVLEQNVHLYNRTAIRRRFYWWNNAGVTRVDDKTRFIYPTHLMATHGFTEIDTWPVNSAGVDMSVVGNHKKDTVGLFAHECREPFMAIYHPTLRSGVVHYADPKQVPGKKVYSWGATGDKWVTSELSDNTKSYVEMQAGLFADQETFGFLQPGESRRFSEYWMPVRGLGGVARANLEGVLNLQRSADSGGRIQLTVEFDANHKIPRAKLRVSDGSKTVWEESADLDPAAVFAKTLKGLPSEARYTFQLLDQGGNVLLKHTEDEYDASPANSAKLGPRPATDRTLEPKTAEGFLELGEYNELQDHTGDARASYGLGLSRFPDFANLHLAFGRLAVGRYRFEEAVAALSRAKAIAPGDAEARYYLGVAYAGLGDDAKARPEFESVGARDPQHAAASLALAELLARARDYDGALKLLDGLLVEQPGMIRAGAALIALLRHAGQTEKAQTQLARFRAPDPTDASLRFEQTRLGKDDPQLWQHLGSDPERVLNVAIGYMDLGYFDDALLLLNRKYPAPVDIMATEPASVLPQHYPLVGYYRAYCMMKAGQPARKELDDASGYFTEYVFASRPSTYQVLRFALKENPSDGTALFLLGELYLFSEDVDKAIEVWQQARSAGFRRAELFRNLGRALGELKKDSKAATAVYQQGVKIAPTDPDLQQGLQALFGPKNLPKPASSAPAETIPGPALPKTFQVQPDSPKAWAIYALGLAAEGRFQDAMGVFQPAHFPNEKQEDLVRESYIQVQVHAILALARRRQCQEAQAGEEHLGDEDSNLPFTFHSFGPIVGSVRIQYSLSMAEALCGNEKGAKKIWGKLAKLSKAISDPDFAIPLIASAKLGPEAETRPRMESALAKIKTALDGAGGDRSTLLYSQGLLLRALGREKDAQSSFVEAIGTQATLVSFLALTALRQQ